MEPTKPATPRKPRPKPERHIGILEQPGPDDPQAWFAIHISLTTATRKTTHTQTTVYLCREIPADGMGAGCRGFELEKLGADLEPTGEVYHVLLDAGDGHGSCDCKGHERHSHCKHKQGIEALCKAGQLKPRFRSAGDFAANDPAGYAEHMASIAGAFGDPRINPDEPPQLDEAAYFDPRDEDIQPDPAA